MRIFFRSKPLFFLLSILLAGRLPAAAQALAGSYTIDAGQATGGTNFASFNEAVDALSLNGISAAVTFNVAPGTYNEQVIIPAISGASAAHTITFTGDGNASLVYTSVNASERAVLKLDGAHHINIHMLNITGTGSTSAEYGYGIQLIHGASYNSITGCKVSVSLNSSPAVANNFAGILVNSNPSDISAQGNAGCHHNLVTGNTVTGGYYGIALVAAGDTYTIEGNQVTDNQIQDFYRSGIYLDGNKGTLVSGNDILRRNINTGLFWGITLYNSSTDLQVSNNTIHDPFGVTTSSSGSFGLYLYNATGTPGHENVFFNNIVYNFVSLGITDGIELSANSSYNKFIHNTIVLNGPASSAYTQARGIAVNAPMSGLTITNNIVYISRTTQGGKHCIYLSNTPVSSQVDYNDLVLANTAGLVASGIGYASSGNRVQLSDWQSATGFDAASLSADPQFANIAAGNLMPANEALQAGLSVSGTGIATDILGMGRNTTPPPTLGAYEINGVVLPVVLSALTGRTGADGRAQLSWSTYTEKDNRGFLVAQSRDGSVWREAGFVAPLAGGTGSMTRAYTFTDPQVLSGPAFYRIAQTDADGGIQYSNVVLLSAAAAQAGVPEVFPNPAGDHLFVVLAGNPAGQAQAVISDMTGKTAWSGTVGAHDGSVATGRLQPGVYLLTVRYGGQLWQVRFVKK